MGKAKSIQATRSKVTATRKECRDETYCSKHGYDYFWCYTNGGGWDYCCQPGSRCAKNTESYYPKCEAGSKWAYCLPNKKKEKKKECRNFRGWEGICQNGMIVGCGCGNSKSKCKCWRQCGHNAKGYC